MVHCAREGATTVTGNAGFVILLLPSERTYVRVRCHPSLCIERTSSWGEAAGRSQEGQLMPQSLFASAVCFTGNSVQRVANTTRFACRVLIAGRERMRESVVERRTREAACARDAERTDVTGIGDC
mmetsp:Transcript_42549/g.105998  ORF Transcript_42549/g.105998 Transcript_42549/m.105998 type:complete len:126 (-) Transcript_42549:231-608(-)